MKTMYHATETKNLIPILMNGLKRNGSENVIFLCDAAVHAAKFLVVRGVTNFVVIPVEVDETLLEESFDHSESFFKCKAWMYPKDIDKCNIDIEHILKYGE